MTGPGPDLVIREAVSADLGPVVQIERRSFADAWSVEALFGELQADAMRLPLVAEVQGEVAGYLMAWLVADQLHVLNIATDPDRLRRGVGTALLLEAARRARPRAQRRPRPLRARAQRREGGRAGRSARRPTRALPRPEGALTAPGISLRVNTVMPGAKGTRRSRGPS